MGYKTFDLIKNSKNPTDQWHTKTFKYHKDGQLGVPCGPVNGIMVVDLDLYKDEAGEFRKTFPDFKTWTRTIKTPRGGYHLYFKYEEGMFKNKAYGYIDVKTKGGYVVGAGSVINGISYTVATDIEPATINEELKLFLYSKVPKPEERTAKPHMFIFMVSDVKFLSMCEKIDITLFNKGNYNMWFLFTTACKAFGKKEIWQELNKQHRELTTDYNEQTNEKIWDSCETAVYEAAIVATFNTAYEPKTMKIKPVIQNTETPDEIDNRKYIQMDLTEDAPSVYENPSMINLVQSDTGTGKTRSFIHYLKRKASFNFISITNRIELGKDQYRNISEAGIDCKFYGTQNDFNQGDNIIIQLDSINKITKLDVSNYCLFLDEINALLSYLAMSSTLDKTRCIIFKRFTKMIRNCKKIIGVDKNISDAVLHFIKSVRNDKIYFFRNDHKKWQGTVIKEWDNEKELYEKIKEQDAYLLITDEYRQITKADHILQDKDVYWVSKYTKNCDHLDDHKKAGFNPKITQGVDLQMPRPVFGIYNTTTITADEMFQQLTRCRNPTEMNLIFLQNRCVFNDIDTDELLNEIKNSNNEASVNFTEDADTATYSLFIDVYMYYRYNKISMQSNPKEHLYIMLRDAGFIIQPNNKKVRKAITDKELTQINDTKLIETVDDEKHKLHLAAYQKINEILKLPAEVAKEHPALFNKGSTLQQHFNICKYNQRDADELKEVVQEKQTFKILKLKSNENKIRTFKRFQQEFKCVDSLEKITIPADHAELFLEYKNVFTTRSKKEFSFDDAASVRDCIVNIGQGLFGFGFFSAVGEVRTTRQVKGKRKDTSKNIYDYCTEFIQLNEDLSKHRHNSGVIIPLTTKPKSQVAIDLDRVIKE